MGLRDWWDRLRGSDDELEPEGAGAGFQDFDDPGTSGADPLDWEDSEVHDDSVLEHFRPALDRLRWQAVNDAAPASRMGLDPETWPQADIRLESERFLGHSHEAVRDELAVHVHGRLRDGAQRLYSSAAWIAELRDHLRRVDKRLIETTSDHDRLYRAVSRNPTEMGRYYRLRSQRTQRTKWLIGGTFVATELFLSGGLFQSAIGTDVPGLGYLVALGLMLLLIVVPHYAAAGLKEGRSEFHSHRSYAPPEPEPNEQELHVHLEKAEDRVFRVVAGGLLVMLLALIVPLSWLRASETLEGDLFWPLFALYLFLQLAISGYFFLREYLDHTALGYDLKVMGAYVEELDLRRQDLIADYGEALQEFHEEAEELVLALKSAPHWDDWIVEQYHATISGFRAGLSTLQPELAPFLAYSTKPGLDAATAPEGSARGLDPLSHENPTLASPGPRGRTWWIESLITSVAELPETEIGMYTDAGWLYTKSPFDLLEDFLRRFYDLDIAYEAPEGLVTPAIPTLTELMGTERLLARGTSDHRGM